MKLLANSWKFHGQENSRKIPGISWNFPAQEIVWNANLDPPSQENSWNFLGRKFQENSWKFLPRKFPGIFPIGSFPEISLART